MADAKVLSKNVEQMIHAFVADGGATELAFDPNLEKADRALIHVLAQARTCMHMHACARCMPLHVHACAWLCMAHSLLYMCIAYMCIAYMRIAYMCMAVHALCMAVTARWSTSLCRSITWPIARKARARSASSQFPRGPAA